MLLKHSKMSWIKVLIALIAFYLLVKSCVYYPERKYELAVKAHTDSVELRKKKVKESLEQLPIQDLSLKACIQQAANELASIPPMNTGGIDDVRELKNLYCRNMKISSIDGIEAFSELQFLDIGNNDVDNIQPLIKLNSLKILDLSKNPIKNLELVAKIKSLEKLFLPDLNSMTCEELKVIADNVKTNLNPSDCLKKRDGIFVINKKKSNQLKDNNKFLSEKEEKDITDYEYNLNRQLDK